MKTRRNTLFRWIEEADARQLFEAASADRWVRKADRRERAGIGFRQGCGRPKREEHWPGRLWLLLGRIRPGLFAKPRNCSVLEQ